MVALAVGDHLAALEHLDPASLGDLTPRAALVRQVLLAAPRSSAATRERASLPTCLRLPPRGLPQPPVVTTAPQVTRYLIEHSAQAQPEPFIEQIIGAALKVRAMQPGSSRSGGDLAMQLTAAELRVWETAGVPFVADHLGAWLIGVLADAGQEADHVCPRHGSAAGAADSLARPRSGAPPRNCAPTMRSRLSMWRW